MPYMERRAWATCRAHWPEVDPRCTSTGQRLGPYADLLWRRDAVSAGEIIANIVGDLDRIDKYPALGYAVEQPMPEAVRGAFALLAGAGYDSKIVRECV
jgi:hypothetical protein